MHQWWLVVYLARFSSTKSMYSAHRNRVRLMARLIGKWRPWTPEQVVDITCPAWAGGGHCHKNLKAVVFTVAGSWGLHTLCGWKAPWSVFLLLLSDPSIAATWKEIHWCLFFIIMQQHPNSFTWTTFYGLLLPDSEYLLQIVPTETVCMRTGNQSVAPHLCPIKLESIAHIFPPCSNVLG